MAATMEWLNEIATGMIPGVELSANQIGIQFKRPPSLQTNVKLSKLLKRDPRFVFIPPSNFMLAELPPDLQFLEHIGKFTEKKLVHCEIFSNLQQEFKKWKNEGHDMEILDILRSLREKQRLEFHLRTKRILLECSQGRIKSRIGVFNAMSEVQLEKWTNKHLDKEILNSFEVRKNIGNIEKNKGGIVISPQVIFGDETSSSKISIELNKKVLVQNNGTVARKLVSVTIVTHCKKPKESSSNIFQVEYVKNKTIPPGGAISIIVTARPTTFGVFKSMIAFQFNGFGIGRFLTVKCGDPAFDNELKPSSPPTKKDRKPKYNAKPKKYVPGPRVQSNSKSNGNYLRMGEYAIPNDLYDSHLEDFQERISIIRFSLESTLGTRYNEILYPQVKLYKELYELLLWYEEIELRINMQQYNMPRTLLTRTGGGAMWRLMVPGLAEKRPSVMIGDFVLASDANATSKKQLFQGVVHAVAQDHVLLKFDASFEVPSSVSIEFEFPRRTMKILHQGLYLLDKVAARNPDQCCMKVLYPSSQHVPTSPPVQIRACLEGLNQQQTQAVLSIIHRAANIHQYPSPYVIFGPPGTGKTHTVVSSVKMLCGVFANDDHFLITAPSNTAADLLLTKLSEFLDPTQMFRFMSFQRDPKEVTSLVKKYCNYDDNQYGFTSPSLSKLESFRVIVATTMMSGKLHNYGIKANWFRVVVIDEAGHSWEPENLATFASQQEGTLVILAGDPRQLGPVTHSTVGKELGLGTSLLERLLEREIYARNMNRHSLTGGYDSNCVTKLIACYRCHPNIIHVPNQLFYDGDLIDATNEEARIFENWSGLQQPKFPVIFHNLQGENEQEGASPSWFNQAEVLQALGYVSQLTSNTGSSPSIQPHDIGIIAPYQKQVKKLKSALGKMGLDDVMVGSCEQFQGQERKVIIISTVRTTQDLLGLDSKFNLGFVTNPKRMNVAMTRAKALLIVIGSAELLSHDPNWSTLIHYCISHGAYRGDPLYKEGRDNGYEGRGAEEVAGEEEDEEMKTRKMFHDMTLDPNQSQCTIS